MINVRYTFVFTNADIGGSGTFSPGTANSGPEAATLLLIGAALATARVARRQLQR
jgi:hypothetical protein